MAAHRKLAESLFCYRIGDPDGEFPVFGGEGAARFPGRWNESGQAIIYTSVVYSTALLEKLARTIVMPANQHFVTIELPAGTSYEEFNEARLPGWDDAYGTASRFGAQWFEEQRSAILFVPSVVARIDRNLLINPRHPDFARVTASREVPIWWDERLFRA